jgi:hypothetical protein
MDCEGMHSSQNPYKRSRIMDDRNKVQIDSVGGRRPQETLNKSSGMTARHQERIDDLARSALECADQRQAVLRFAMAKSFGMGALVSEKVEHVLRVGPMTIREFRKHVVPMLSTAANLFKQGARCAQIDREYDQMIDREGEGPPLLPSGEAEN